MGIYLYPGIPNTTVTRQGTEQNYGLFKRIFTSNLDFETSQLQNEYLLCNSQPWMIKLIMFGGLDSISEVKVRECVFEKIFQRRRVFNQERKLGQKIDLQVLGDTLGLM